MSMGVAAYHVIITNYGFWLPNDPRGSWSDFVRSWEIYLAGGPATGTDTRRSVAGVSHNARQRLVAKNALVRDPVVWTGVQAKAVGDGFARFVAKSALNIFACAIMPRHTHLVFERTTYLAEQVTNLLKGEATKELNRCDLHPFRDFGYSNGKLPSPWARKQWICYLNDESDIGRAIEYVEKNPLKEGKPPQCWPFVRQYRAV